MEKNENPSLQEDKFGAKVIAALHGIPADIGQFTEAGMTDPEVGRLTFARVLGREPTDQKMARLLGANFEPLPGVRAAQARSRGQ